MRPPGNAKALENRRTMAIKFLQHGKMPHEVAQELNVGRRSIRKWKAAYSREGLKGIQAKPTPGRPAYLSDQGKEQLQRILLEGAQKEGFESDLWTCPRIAEVIREHFGVSYHVDHVCKLLHNLGWSPQKPQRQAVEHNSGAVKHWVRYKWPRIKKKRAS